MRVSLPTIFSSVLCTVLVSSQELNPNLDTYTTKCVANYGIPPAGAESIPGSFSNTDCANDAGARGAVEVAVNKLKIDFVYGVTRQVVAGTNYVVFVSQNERNYRVPIYQDLNGDYSLEQENICYTLTKAEIKEWRALFKSMNKNSRDKILTEDELVNWVNTHPDSGILTEENARMLFKTMDVNEDQVVTFSEFIDGFHGRYAPRG
ncbi:hypothetical protein BDV37DRAFT_288557 [Aspergillus pseudonomiae]|uniref:EF-hand domain-containing protein n=1 Tax=Aspergillus pseudonomiae TaxID=1506151 RepID=A0A5N7CW66_9EURO|nr:uncharacterized protein BDV37DRAFT_288557 [Aspergillus pseudonomiae]KAE8398420.1 hypothetical protein BDV37DRAFT_288557 [Aspergillus pseudonomiae]